MLAVLFIAYEEPQPLRVLHEPGPQPLGTLEEAEADDEAEEEAEELVLPHLSFARTENWVEYWNSPVPSTMISMPYPVSVD